MELFVKRSDSQLEDVKDNLYALNRKRHAYRADTEDAHKKIGERKKKLAELKPDSSIKNATRRKEQFEKSKAHIEKLLTSAEKRVQTNGEAIDKLSTTIGELDQEKGRMDRLMSRTQEVFYPGETAELKIPDDFIGQDSVEDYLNNDDKNHKSTTVPDQNVDMDFPSNAEGTTNPRPHNIDSTVKDKDLIQSADVIKLIKNHWPALSIRGKATHRKKTRGWYQMAYGQMRLQDVRDVDAALHELGHHFDRQMGMWSKSTGLPSGIPSELIQLGKDLYGDKRPANGYRAEGFAEFIRGYLTGDDMRTHAPKLYDWFTTEYLPARPKEAKGLRELEHAITALRNRSPEQVVRAFRQPLKQKWDRQRIAASMAATEAKHRDKNLPILRAMQSAGIQDLRPADDPYMLATAYSRSAGGRALYSVIGQSIDLIGDHTGESLRDALRPVSEIGKEAVENWKDYAIARRALDLHERDINPGISKEDAQAVVDKYGSAEFDAVTDAVTDWSRRQLHLLVESGAMTEKEFEDIVESNPVYVPFSRQFEDGELRGGRKSGDGKKGAYRIKGSGREINDPLDALIMQSEKITEVAMQADVARAIVKIHDTHKGRGSLGKMISEVPAPQEATVFTADKIKKQMAEKAVELGADPNVVAAAMLETWNNRMTVFTPASEYKGKDNIISIVVDGNRRFFEVDHDLMDVLTGINADSILPGIIGELSRQAVGLQRLGATGLNAAFGLLRNPLRDTLTAAVTAEYHFQHPITINARRDH